MKLKDICEISAGGTPSRSNKEFWTNGNIPWLKISDLKNKYIDKSEEYITETALKNSSAKLFSKGTVLYTIFATIGETGILNFDATTNQAIAGLKIKDKSLQSEYLYYYMKSLKEKMLRESRGVAQNNINLSILRELEIKIPNQEDQKHVIESLSKLEDLIYIKKNEIDKCNNLIKSQFVEMFENKDFPYVQFKEYMERCEDIGSNGANAVVMEHYNMTDTKDYAMVIRFTNLNSGDFEKDVKYINKEDYEFYSKSKVYGDEIIFCKIGSAGVNYIMPKLNMPVTLGLNQIMVTPKNINIRYLYEYINSYEGKKYINNNINGAVTKTITKHALWDFPIKIPPIELQNKFSQIVEQIDKQKFVNAKLLQLLGKNLKRCYNNIIDFR